MVSSRDDNFEEPIADYQGNNEVADPLPRSRGECDPAGQTEGRDSIGELEENGNRQEPAQAVFVERDQNYPDDDGWRAEIRRVREIAEQQAGSVGTGAETT